MNRPWWARPAAALLFGLVRPARVHGAGLVPADGPVILASNHLAFVDGPLLAAVQQGVTRPALRSGPPVPPVARLGTPGRTALTHATATVREVLAERVARAVAQTGQALPGDYARSARQVARGEHL